MFSRNALRCLLIFCALSASHLTANELKLTTIDSVKSEKSCFHNVFASYDAWFNFLYSKRENAFKRRGLKNISQQLKKFEDGFKSRFSKADFDAAKQGLHCQRFTYEVNGKDVEGVLILPKSNNIQGEKTPLILYNRGGTRRFGQLVFGHIAHELFPLALKGYAIIASDYRKDEQYGADNIDEVTQLIDVAESIPSIKTDKIHVYGISRGGLTSMQLARERPSKIASIVSISGVMNSEMWAQNREGIQNNISLINGYKKDPETIHNKLSPVQWASELPQVPILLIHSEDDDKVSVEHSLQLADKLTELNRPHKTIIYPDGGHSIIGHKTEATEATVQWFKAASNAETSG